MSEKSSNSFTVTIGLFWLWLAFMMWSDDATERGRKGNPYSMGAAISCHIGGAAFCPKS